MGKEFRSEKEKKRKVKKVKSKSEFKAFLKKRAPLYLGIIAVFIIFLVPELTKSNLESSFPQDLTENQSVALEILMSYNGENQEGLTTLEALEIKIEEEYPNEKIYDNKDTQIEWIISNDNSEDTYEIQLIFESYNGNTEYLWNVFLDTHLIQAENSNAKNIIEIVDYYD